MARLHEREWPCNKAEAELGCIILDLSKKHELTEGASLILTSAACHNWLAGLVGNQEVPEAADELMKATADLVKKYELTEAEQIRVVVAACQNWLGSIAKYAIREERHGNTDTPGGLARDEEKPENIVTVNHFVTKLSEFDEDGKVVVSLSGKDILIGSYKIRSNNHEMEVVTNGTKLKDHEAEYLLSELSSDGVGEWINDWEELEKRAKPQN